MSKSSSLADDITQETFLQIFRKYHTYDPAQPISPWIYKIALNITRNTLRRQKWLHFIKDIPEKKDAYSLEDEILKNELHQELWKEINHLTLKGKEVIVMHYYLGLKLNEIAAVLGIPVGTCKSRLHAALTALAQQLKRNPTMISYKGEDIYESI